LVALAEDSSFVAKGQGSQARMTDAIRGMHPLPVGEEMVAICRALLPSIQSCETART
jgi:hypothetical protein